MDSDSPERALTIVLVDDDRAHLNLIERSVQRAFLEDPREIVVLPHTCADQALAELPVAEECVILMDYRMGATTGLDWLGDFVREDVGPVIILTSSGDEAIAAEAFRQGASDYLQKGDLVSDPMAIRRSIGESIRRHRIERSNRELRGRLKKVNRELSRKNERLAELTDTAHRFVDDVAHEFRTPLAVIKEFAAIMADGLGGPVSDAQQGYLNFIDHATQDLADLVDDFLDSGKLQARTLRVDRRSHAVDALITETLPMLEARARARAVRLVVDIADDVPPVFCDAEKVRRILINLVVNAVKFSTADQPVTISAAADLDDPHAIRISVTDEGPGLPPEEVEHLFTRFRQGDAAGRIHSRGFGLGLNIVRSLVDINLGEVAVASTLGEGSTFSFTLPRCGMPDIVARLTDNARRREPRGTLSVFRVHRPGSKATAEQTAAFLGSVSHAGDVILPGPDEASVFVVLETSTPEGWRQRVIAADERLRREAETATTPIAIERVGSWFIADGASPILAALGRPSEVLLHE
jgi:signal transduction histidine kinase